MNPAALMAKLHADALSESLLQGLDSMADGDFDSRDYKQVRRSRR